MLILLPGRSRVSRVMGHDDDGGVVVPKTHIDRRVHGGRVYGVVVSDKVLSLRRHLIKLERYRED